MLLRKYSQRYLKVWIAYNEAIATHLQKLRPENYIVTDFNTLYHQDESVFCQLAKKGGFSLSLVRFRNIFKEHQVHEPAEIDSYIKDKSLLRQAAAAETLLRQLSSFSPHAQTMYAV